MNHAAKYVLIILGIVLLGFSAVTAIAPFFGKEAPKAVTDHLATLIVAFVGMLARTGKEPTEEKP